MNELEKLVQASAVSCHSLICGLPLVGRELESGILPFLGLLWSTCILDIFQDIRWRKSGAISMTYQLT